MLADGRGRKRILRTLRLETSSSRDPMIQILREWKLVGSTMELSQFEFKSSLISGCAMSEDPRDRCITSVSVEVYQPSSRMCSAFTSVGNGRRRRLNLLNMHFQ